MSNLKSKPKASPNAKDSGERAVEVLSGPVGPRFRDIAFMVPKEYLDRFFDWLAATTDEEPVKPTTASELHSLLLEVDRLGWQWTADDPPALTSKSNDADFKALSQLSKTYPAFPEELAEIVKYVLWGWKPSQRKVGPLSDLRAKAAAVSEILLTEDYRSEFFFKHATRLRRFHDLDWEIVVKTAERNIKKFPGAVYVNLSLETKETQPDFEDHAETLLFAADAKAIARMIALLQDALKEVERAKVMTHNMRHREGADDVK